MNDPTDAEIAPYTYDAITGVIYRDGTPMPGYKLGHKGIYRGLWIKQNVLMHRLAWRLHYGYWPERLDHENLNTTDNRIDNLREATCSQNGANAGIYKNNKLGVKGVVAHGNKYRAQIKYQGIKRHLGTFGTIAEASSAYASAAANLHGKFARTA